MYASECCVGRKNMTPTAARDEMVKPRQGDDPVFSNTCIDQIRAVAGLCNAGEFDAASENLPLHERKINGDATDQAILRFSEGLGPVSELRRMWKKRFDLGFNSKNKFMIRVLSLAKQEGLLATLPLEEYSSFNHEEDM